MQVPVPQVGRLFCTVQRFLEHPDLAWPNAELRQRPHVDGALDLRIEVRRLNVHLMKPLSPPSAHHGSRHITQQPPDRLGTDRRGKGLPVQPRLVVTRRDAHPPHPSSVGQHRVDVERPCARLHVPLVHLVEDVELLELVQLDTQRLPPFFAIMTRQCLPETSRHLIDRLLRAGLRDVGHPIVQIPRRIDAPFVVLPCFIHLSHTTKTLLSPLASFPFCLAPTSPRALLRSLLPSSQLGHRRHDFIQLPLQTPLQRLHRRHCLAQHVCPPLLPSSPLLHSS